MGLLSGLFSNDSVKNLAFGQLVKFFKDDGIKSIVLTYSPGGSGTMIPDCDVQMFKVPTIIYPKGTVGITTDQMEDYKELASERAYVLEQLELFQCMTTEQAIAWRDPEVKDIINRYLKAKKLNDGINSASSASETDTDSEHSGHDSDNRGDGFSD